MITPATPATIPSGHSEAHDRAAPDHVNRNGLNRFERVLHAVLNKLFKRRDIIIDNELYLRRWFITPRSWKKRVFLHCILRPDEDRHLHDHPWNFATLVLKGGYDETFYMPEDALESWGRHPLDLTKLPMTVDNFPKHSGGQNLGELFMQARYIRRVRPGCILVNKAEHTHAVKPYNGIVWTLLLVDQAKRVWGFWDTERGCWRDWRSYLGLPADTPDYPEDDH